MHKKKEISLKYYHKFTLIDSPQNGWHSMTPGLRWNQTKQMKGQRYWKKNMFQFSKTYISYKVNRQNWQWFHQDRILVPNIRDLNLSLLVFIVFRWGRSVDIEVDAKKTVFVVNHKKIKASIQSESMLMQKPDLTFSDRTGAIWNLVRQERKEWIGFLES